MEEWHARGLFMEAEQVHGLPEFAVVALFCFLQEMEIGLQVFFVEKSRAVYALKLGIGRIGPPVRPGDLCQFEGLDKTGVRNMGAPAQIREISMGIKRNGSVRKIGYHLLFVGFIGVKRDRLGLGDLLPLKRQFRLDGFFHLRFDPGKILFGDRRHVYVIVESVLHGRAYGQFCVRVEVEHCLGHDMGSAVAQDIDGFIVPGGDKPHGCVTGDGGGHVHQFSIELHGYAIAGESVGDAPGHFKPGRRLFEGFLVAVWKSDIDHWALTV